MHILILPSIYPTPNRPYRGKMYLEQADALVRRGHQVGVLAPPSRVRTQHGLREFLEHWQSNPAEPVLLPEHKFPVYRIPWWGWLATWYRPARAQIALSVYEQYCHDQGQPDVLFAIGTLYGGYLAAKLKAIAQLPVVITEHFSAPYLRGPFFPDQKQVVRYALAKADRLFALSRPLAEALAPFAPSRQIDVLPMGIDMEFFALAPTPPLPFVFTVIARLDANKAVDILLNAFARAFKGQPVYLAIVGDGPERSQLEDLARTLEMDRQVRFHGWQSREQTRDLIQNSHVVVSSSYVETFGYTLVEALACGRPVIATSSGGPDSIVTETVGLPVPVGDVDALAQAFVTMTQNYERYSPQAIRAECEARFADAIILGRLEAILQEVAANQEGQA